MRRADALSDGTGTLVPVDRPLIVQSHLRWDFVWQRPQQLLSRLAEHRRVLFVEEPIFLDDVSTPRLDVTIPHANVFRAVPSLPGALRDDCERGTAEIRSLVQFAISPGGELKRLFNNPVQWFYSPFSAPAMLGAFNEVAVVYDCMDELSQFRFAHPDLVRRERLLLANADVVFTGGHKLYESKRRYHHNVHFFGCGVDSRHFGKARLPETQIPADIASLPKPIFGYFGVIDERIDYDLIGALADQRPEASVVMVGPVVKVDPATLPQRSNIHWLGQRDYSSLPGYVKGFLRTVRDAPPSLLATIVADALRTGLPSLARGAWIATHQPFAGAIGAPTLLVWGERDRLVPSRLATEWHKVVPDSRVAIIARARHVPMVDEPSAFAEVLLDFLRDD